jgi:trehalose-6-phosphatase
MPSRHPYDLPDTPPDIRLIVADMDGTLLDDAGRPPEHPWLTKQLRERGVLFSPASGRQYATLAGLFHGFDYGMVYIAENGTYVVRDGQEIAPDPLDTAVAARRSCVASTSSTRSASSSRHSAGPSPDFAAQKQPTAGHGW